jgi:hypothetical protein
LPRDRDHHHCLVFSGARHRRAALLGQHKDGPQNPHIGSALDE